MPPRSPDPTIESIDLTHPIPPSTASPSLSHNPLSPLPPSAPSAPSASPCHPAFPAFPAFPAPPSAMRARPGHYTAARRRIYARRDRLYSRAHPDVVAECLHVEEDAPLSPRHRALSHLSAAYAAAGYAHALLCVVVSLVLAAGVAAFARALYADVARKTSLRADHLAIQAAECLLARTANACLLRDGVATHPTPALDALCKKWLACERRGHVVHRDALSATVWAETFAETVNSFADSISSTAVVIALAATIVLAFLMSSAAFGFMHNKVVAHGPPERSVTHEALLKDSSPFGGALGVEAKRGDAKAITNGRHAR